MSSNNEVLNEIVNVVAEEVYKYLMRRLPEKLLEDIVINVGGFTDISNYTLEISIDAMTNHY
ncbi:hypothetical protein [Vulcanisaeta distributa]|uniref:hypothetical protein n=1 Tax=Vulcanisaeta distributa TaxID=164451 RepID=UPI000A5DE20A|nr:hypothetical protein [Vulcanisaeta distributa]